MTSWRCRYNGGAGSSTAGQHCRHGTRPCPPSHRTGGGEREQACGLTTTVVSDARTLRRGSGPATVLPPFTTTPPRRVRRHCKLIVRCVRACECARAGGLARAERRRCACVWEGGEGSTLCRAVLRALCVTSVGPLAPSPHVGDARSSEKSALSLRLLIPQPHLAARTGSYV